MRSVYVPQPAVIGSRLCDHFFFFSTFVRVAWLCIAVLFGDDVVCEESTCTALQWSVVRILWCLDWVCRKSEVVFGDRFGGRKGPFVRPVQHNSVWAGSLGVYHIRILIQPRQQMLLATIRWRVTASCTHTEFDWIVCKNVKKCKYFAGKIFFFSSHKSRHNSTIDQTESQSAIVKQVRFPERIGKKESQWAFTHTAAALWVNQRSYSSWYRCPHGFVSGNEAT